MVEREREREGRGVRGQLSRNGRSGKLSGARPGAGAAARGGRRRCGGPARGPHLELQCPLVDISGCAMRRGVSQGVWEEEGRLDRFTKRSLEGTLTVCANITKNKPTGKWSVGVHVSQDACECVKIIYIKWKQLYW